MEQGHEGLQNGWNRIGLEQGGLQIRWNRVEQCTGLWQSEPVHLFQSGSGPLWDYTAVKDFMKNRWVFPTNGFSRNPVYEA